MAWMRMMGADSVAYHEHTVLGRSDDHPGQALAYYASRGETPLAWGGRGAERLGLAGAVTHAQYEAVFGPGGACDPTTGARLVRTRRPGMELVVAAHKSVALLGVIGRAEDMHAILDAETDATLSALDSWVARRGGRRGREQSRTETAGLTWARTRHATSRAGDPAPHDHVLVANLVEMADAWGGWKALDTAAVRDVLHAATAVGRVAAARRAAELGYAIEADPGPSGRLGHWRIAGVPREAEAVFSKRSAEIDALMDESGYTTHRARGVAARASRRRKDHTAPEQLLAGWQAELEAAGWPVPVLDASVRSPAGEREPVPARLDDDERRRRLAGLLAPNGPLARRKVFARTDVVVEAAPLVFGHDPAELTKLVTATLADAEVVPLIGVAAARDRVYTTAGVIAREAAIAAAVAERIEPGTGPALPLANAVAAITATERELGRTLPAGQREAIVGTCRSSRGVELVLGVAGAGKTTALDAVRLAYEAAGYTVIGTATSGQATRTLQRDAGVSESRTLASLVWRLDHGQLGLDDRKVVVLDEAGMTDDPAMLRLVVAVNLARAKLVVIGDDRQLGAVGPGGALGALLKRHPGAVHHLADNVRQHDAAEREALAELRAGNVERAVAWYAANGRIAVHPDRDEAIDAMVAAWATDVANGEDTAMLAWRHVNVAELNRRARQAMDEARRLTGPELVTPGGRAYRAGDRVVTLAPGAAGRLVTSERATVTGVDPTAGTVTIRTASGDVLILADDDIAAGCLDHSYATTVHRSQGATFATVHRLEDGGGRELAYVAMSRARHRATAYVVADDPAQATEDLRREWSAERRQAWAIDTGTPTRDPLTAEADPALPATLRTALRVARLRAERAAVAAAVPPDPLRELIAVGYRLAEARERRCELEYGRGEWDGTKVGEAARDLAEARGRRHQAEGFARDPVMSWRMRRTWQRDARDWARTETDAQAIWDHIGAPRLAQLDDQVARLAQREEQLRGAGHRRDDWIDEHPEALRRLRALDRELEQLAPSLAPAQDRSAGVAAFP
ncbi:MAG TPA: MobF family relaxase, partial [Acidimicrobiales bacterium]|nr:MobF family relaxase [Acidimicrobiales bacterium]